MYSFEDVYGNYMTLTFLKEESDSPNDVLIFTLSPQGVVMMKHPVRGIEVPGGKINQDESPSDAAKRELYEETGAIVDKIDWIGHYNIYNKQQQLMISKAIFFATASHFSEIPASSESLGVLFFSTKPEVKGEEFSFIMKDPLFELLWSYLDIDNKLKREINLLR